MHVAGTLCNISFDDAFRCVVLERARIQLNFMTVELHIVYVGVIRLQLTNIIVNVSDSRRSRLLNDLSLSGIDVYLK